MAANTTFDQWITQLTADIKYIETIYQLCSTVTDDILSQEDAITSGLDGNTLPISSSLNALVSMRGNLNLLLGDNAVNFIEARILGVASIINKNGGDVQSLLDGLYEYMIDNAEWFLSRTFTRGSWSAGGSNTGDGEILRVTTDTKGVPIENCFSEVITATIVRNASGAILELTGSTDPGSETMRLEGTVAGDDELDKEIANRGSGLRSELANKRSGDSIINNASFGSYTGTGASITDITDWTITNLIGNFEQDTTNYFVEDNAENGTPASLVITATDTIEQLLSVSGTSFDSDAPYLCQLYYNRAVNSAAGTLELHMGTVSASVVLSAQTGWNVLRLTLGQNSWFENFDNDILTSIKVVWTQTGGTGVLIDDIRCFKLDSFANIPTVCLGGATRWRVNDTGTITDTEVGAVFQRWFWRNYGRYMPSVPTATQVTAAGGRTLTWANSGSADTVTASSGSWITDGYKVGMFVTFAGTSSNNLTTGKLATVTATILTFGSDTSLTNEGPLSATATVNAAANITEPSVSF